VAAAAAVVASGSSTPHLLAAGVAGVLAVTGLVAKNHWLSAASAFVVGLLVVTRFEVFEHQLLAGWAPAVAQRVAVTIAVSCAATVVGSELIALLGASTSETVPT
jgi:hypothetical protein